MARENCGLLAVPRTVSVSRDVQAGQTPGEELEIKNITVYVSGYTETDTTGMLSPPECLDFQCGHLKCLEP